MRTRVRLPSGPPCGPVPVSTCAVGMGLIRAGPDKPTNYLNQQTRNRNSRRWLRSLRTCSLQQWSRSSWRRSCREGLPEGGPFTPSGRLDEMEILPANPSPSAKLLEAYRMGLHTLLCYGRISINDARRRLAEFESLGEGDGKRALRRLLALRDCYRRSPGSQI